VEAGSGGGTSVSVAESSAGSGGAGLSTASGEASASGAGGGSSSSGMGGMGSTGSGGMDAGPPPPVCGDGQKEAPEECDDSNLIPGDRCGPECAVEDPTKCPGTPIALGTSKIVISDDTGLGGEKAQGSPNIGNCGDGNWQGKDLAYAVTPMQSGTLTVTMKAEYGGHLLHLRTQCPGGKAEEIACDYDGSSNTSDVLTLSVTMGQTYYVFPDSWNNSAGKFDLTLELQ